MDSTIKIGKLVEDGLRARRDKIREEILSLMEDIVVDHKETQRLGEQMIFNVAVLIPENKQKYLTKPCAILTRDTKRRMSISNISGLRPALTL